MNDQTKILVALFAFFVGDSVGTRIRSALLARKFDQAYEAQKNLLMTQQEQILYLLHLLIAHGIEIDEFDLIALNFNAED